MRRRAFAVAALLMIGAGACSAGADDALCRAESGAASVARYWSEAALDAVRADFPAPTVHARNLYHLSALTWDIWVNHTGRGTPLFVDAPRESGDAESIGDAIAFGSHRLLVHRYQLSSTRVATREALDASLAEICDVPDELPDESAAAYGIELAEAIIDLTYDDGSLERRAYEDVTYRPVNPPLDVAEPGASLADPDRWQPLLLTVARSQNGLALPGGEQTFIGSQWGSVAPFALEPPGDARAEADRAVPHQPIDPGPPPRHADPATRAEYVSQAVEVVRASAALCAGQSTIDIGPGASEVDPLGYRRGAGHDTNPASGTPYEPNPVDAADYYRAIAEYWADGPTSETPPGHWNVLAHAVSDRIGDLVIGGAGTAVDRLEWDVKLGLALNGALHDAAIAAWGTKAAYDSVRPISMIRWMSGNGQSSDPQAANYSPDGIALVDGLVETITAESAAPGGRHAHLADHLGEIAVRAWDGPPADAETVTACVDWRLGSTWLPYQRPTFVTPAFASYVSGHSTFSRAGAEVLAGFTGSEFFPGGLFEQQVRAGTLLHEEGPSETIVLQWATYFDAADEAGRSRIWGGIHVPADDFAGRTIGAEVGGAALDRSRSLFGAGVGPTR